MQSKKRTQIENRLNGLHCYLDRGYTRGKKVWVAICGYGGNQKYTLSSGQKCEDYWYTLDDAHQALFADAGLRADG